MNNNLSFENDASVLRKAMKGMGTDDDALINLTGNRSNSQRQAIRACYKTAFGRDLLEDLEDELSGDLKNLVIGMWKSPVEYDVNEIYNAVDGMGTDDSSLFDIIGSRSNRRLQEIKTLYKEMYGETLEKRIIDETSGECMNLLVSLIQCNRDESSNVDPNLVQKDVEDLYNAGEGKWGTDEDIFNRIFVLRNPSHLQAVSQAYFGKYGKSLLDVVKSECSGDIKVLLKTLIHAHSNPADYFAESIYKACKGWGTNDKLLIRTMVIIDEAFLADIKNIYKQKYGMTLEAQIKDETEGDYKKMLLELIKS